MPRAISAAAEGLASTALRRLAVVQVIAVLATTGGAAASQRAATAARKPVVILIPGIDGPARYRAEAARISKLGYFAVLLDATIDPISRYGESNLRDAIARAQKAPEARPGKVVVIGFSMGGGGALAIAAAMPDLVAAVVAYYPAVSFLAGERQMQTLAGRFAVPVLALAGEGDTYLDCCRAEAQRALEAAAKGQGKQYELVTYPGAQHGFNLAGRWHDAAASADAARRADEVLRRYLPP